MVRLGIARIGVALAMLGAASAVATEQTNTPVAGPAMIVVAPRSPSPADHGSEAYADYAEYLNAFAARRPAALKLVRMTPAQWRGSARGPAPAGDYAILFVRRGGRALVHDGMPLEAALYDAGARWALGGPAPDQASGLKPIALRAR